MSSDPVLVASSGRLGTMPPSVAAHVVCEGPLSTQLVELARLVPSNRWRSVELRPDMVRVWLRPLPPTSALPLKRPPLTVSASRSRLPASTSRSKSRRLRPRKKSPVQIQRWRERGARGVLRLLAARWKLIQLRRHARLRAPPPRDLLSSASPSLFGLSAPIAPPPPFANTPSPFSLESLECLAPVPAASPAFVFSASPSAPSVSTPHAPSLCSPSTPSQRSRPSSPVSVPPPPWSPLDERDLFYVRSVAARSSWSPCIARGRHSPPPPPIELFFSLLGRAKPYTFL